jgi:hypothetical protein
MIGCTLIGKSGCFEQPSSAYVDERIASAYADVRVRGS